MLGQTEQVKDELEAKQTKEGIQEGKEIGARLQAEGERSKTGGQGVKPARPSSKMSRVSFDSDSLTWRNEPYSEPFRSTAMIVTLTPPWP